MEGEVAALLEILPTLEYRTVEALQVLSALIDEQLFHPASFIGVRLLHKSHPTLT